MTSNNAISSDSSKKIIFVLGMHRSGTSLIAKALQVVGADLGDNLMPAAPDNPKGFWEDLDIFQFNERLLEFIDMRWDIPSTLSSVNFRDPKFKPWKREAIHILRLKVLDSQLYAVKDPRLCLLISFWSDVAKTVGLSVQYVVMVRNPLDTTRSLKTRNAFEEIKSLSLWVSHYYIVLSELYKSHDRIIFFEYQRVIAEPFKQLSRLSYFVSGMRLSKSSISLEIDGFLDDFMDKSLSHADSQLDDLEELEYGILGLIEIYQCLQGFVKNRWSRSKAKQVLEGISIYELESKNYQLQLYYFKKETKQALELQKKSLVSESQSILRSGLRDKDIYYKEILEKKDHEFQNAIQGILEKKDYEFQKAIQAIVEKKDHEFHKTIQAIIEKKDFEYQKNVQSIIAKKDQELQIIIDKKDSSHRLLIGEKDNQFLSFIRKINDKNTHDIQQKDIVLKNHAELIKKLEQENLVQTNRMNQMRDLHTRELESWSAAVQDLKKSYSWKITAPLRILLDIVKSPSRLLIIKGRTCISKFEKGLEQDNSRVWKTINDDPQFHLDISGINISKGWYIIEFKAQPLEPGSRLYPELFVDYGDGFSEEHSLNFECGIDSYKLTVFFQRIPVGIRIDPCRYKGFLFSLGKIRVRKLPLPFVIISASINIYRRDRKNGRNPASIILEKLQLIRRYGLFYTMGNLHSLIDSNEEESDWGVEYPQWISEVESGYFKYLTERQPVLNRYSQEHQHAVLVIASSLADTKIVGSVQSAYKQLLSPAEILVLQSQNSEIYCCSIDMDGNISKKTEFKSWSKATKSSTVTFLKSGDSLSEYYLLSLTDVLNTSSGHNLIYPDSDYLSSSGARCNPLFKPDWSPDFILESNYIGETFSLSLECLAQYLYQYSFDIRLMPIYILYRFALNDRKDIHHIAYILVHHSDREHTNINHGQHDMLKKILPNYCDADLVEDNTKEPARYRVSYSLPKQLPSVTIIIPTKDRLELLSVCIETLVEKTDYRNYNLIIVDNESVELETHAYFKTLSSNPAIRVISYNKPFNYSAINNFAVSYATSEIVCFLNNDIEIINSHWLSELVSHAIRPEVGCVGAKLYYPDKRIQHGGVIIGVGGVAGHAFSFDAENSQGYLSRLDFLQNYSAVTGACLVMRKDIFCSIDGFNEKYLPVAFNDTDLCLRLKEQGYRVIWTPYAELIHHESATRVDDETRTNEIQSEVQFMKMRWSEWIARDPCYNHHLSLAIGRDFDLSLRQENTPPDSFDTSDTNPAESPYCIENNEARISNIIRENQNDQVNRVSFNPGLSIIILTLEKPELIGPLLKNLVQAKHEFSNKNIDMEIIVGDTGSTSSDINSLYQEVESNVTIIRDLRYHFSRCNNELFCKYAQFDSVLFLNNDVIFHDASESLHQMYRTLHQYRETGIVGSFLTYPDGRLQHGGVSVIEEGDYKGLCYHPDHGSIFVPPDINYTKVMPAVTGACLLIKSDLFILAGMFDTTYSAEAQDVDLCFQLRRLGYESVLCYPGEIQHLENATRPKGEANNKDRAHFVRKWALFYNEIVQ